MIPIVTPAQMAAVDAAAPEPVDELIARAGWAVARTARRMLGGTYAKRVVILAGAGNNGADGRVAAEWLARWGVRVRIIDAGREQSTALPAANLVIDAAFGTGLSRPYVAPALADHSTPVLAVDIPSGLSGLTGEVLGEPLAADVTVTFAALKPGHLLGHGPRLCGQIDCVDIGLDTSGATAWKVVEGDVAAWVTPRATDAHKWRSALRLVAGSPGMNGSADLATAAALRAGAGYVRRSTPGFDPARDGLVASGPIEAVTTALASSGWATDVLADIERFGALAIGPGLGRAASLTRELASLIAAPVPIVIDGDGLRALGTDAASLLGERPAGSPPVVLTPHDAEFAALGGDTETADRIASVRDLAAATGAIVLRKGPTTIVANPQGHALVVDSGDARLATAGTGDVLTGVIGAFLARGVPSFEAAACAAWVHGTAACQGRRVGLIASDLADPVADVLGTLQGLR